MSAATVIAPLSYGQAVELANGIWAKRVLPVGSISYQGRQLHFTPDYLRTLENAFRAGAYDQVSFQLADSKNSHTNDPERHRGTIVDMKAQADGLYVYVQPTPRGVQVLRENPNLGVSARIVEQYSRADGRHFPAAIQHVLGTLDPRVNGLGPWTELANGDGGMVIDLSGSSFPGDGPPAYADPLDALIDGSGLSDAEQMDLLEAIYTASGGEDGGELSDAELDALVAQAEAEAEAQMYEDPTMAALGEFGRAFSQREQARAEQDAEKYRPRDEDRLARAVQRLAAGTYTPAYGLANEMALASLGVGACGQVDPVTGLCAERFHSLDCEGHAPGSDRHDLANDGGADALNVLALSMASGGGTDDDGPPLIPARYLELAHVLNESWGMHGDVPAHSYEPDASDLFGQRRHGDTYSAMAAELGRDDLASPQLGQRWPDVSALRRGLGL